MAVAIPQIIIAAQGGWTALTASSRPGSARRGPCGAGANMPRAIVS